MIKDKDEFIGLMSEAFSDAEEISKSFLRQAIERSVDVGINPVLTLTMVKAFCDLAIDDHRKRFEKEHPLSDLLKSNGEWDVFKELEDLVTKTIKGSYVKFKKAQFER